jgi:hypothetical protein
MLAEWLRRPGADKPMLEKRLIIDNSDGRARGRFYAPLTWLHRESFSSVRGTTDSMICRVMWMARRGAVTWWTESAKRKGHVDEPHHIRCDRLGIWEF